MNTVELKAILELHKEWLNDNGGSRADLRDADLSDADLSGADLSRADLRGADLRDADLRGADLRDADLSDADMSGADLRGADPRGADLSGVVANEYTSFYWLSCPETGEFTAYKKCANDSIVTLLITADAKRSSATTRKCRASRAVVIAIENSKGEVLEAVKSRHDSSFIYKVGETVQVDNFDEDRWNECSTGIHFFITRREAELY